MPTASRTWFDSAPRREWLVILGLTALYVALPTRNSTLDAWYYAACVRWSHELLLPHHLLYNAVGWLWVQLLAAIGLHPDTLAALRLLNALAAGSCLVVLRRLLHLVGPPTAPVAAWLLVAGSSFGLMRFATENEAYVLPLLFSLLASLSWTRYQVGRQQRLAQLWWAGLWAVLACLLHQIHVFWWVGLLSGAGWLAQDRNRPPFRALLCFGSSALLVPVAYVAALFYWQLPRTASGLWQFVFHDYYSGTATGGLSGKGLLLTVANFIRTFGQVHGTTLALLRQVPGLAAVPMVAVLLVLYAGRIWWRQRRATSASVAPVQRRVGQVHGLIFLLQLLFAAVSAGNAEFMVMLPLLLPVWVVSGLVVPGRSVAVVGSALLLWNLAFGLLPSHFLLISGASVHWLPRIRQESRALFLLADPGLARNQLHYYTGQAVAPPRILASPTLLLLQRPQSPAVLHAWLRRQQRAGYRLFTDALDGPQLLDRAQIMFGDQNAAVLQGFHRARVDSSQTIFGTYYLTELR